MQNTTASVRSRIRLVGISSMATRSLLADIAELHRQYSDVDVQFESVGGVEAARRVQAGEAFDLVALASPAIDELIESGHIVADSKTDFVVSSVAVAVRSGSARPAVDDENAVRDAVLAARRIGYSTGPSGTALIALLTRWNVIDAVRERLVQAKPGLPVGRLIADGVVDLGFQQLSELIDLTSVDVLGTMPASCGMTTVFSAGLGVSSSYPSQARDLLNSLRFPQWDELKRRHGMAPA